MHDTGSPHASAGAFNEKAADRESANLLNIVFRASPTPISISRFADGSVIDANEEWTAFTGYSVADIGKEGFSERELWVDDREYKRLRAEAANHAHVRDREVNLRTRSGDAKTVLLSLQRVTVQGQDCLVTVMNDITERKRAEQALVESEARFHTLADTAPVLIWLIDEHRRCTYCNRSWIEFTGQSIEGGLNAWLEYVHEEDQETCRELFERAVERQVPFSMEYRLRRHDGTFSWMLDKGVPRYRADDSFAGYIRSCVDISDQKETEKKLLEAKEHAEEMSKLKTTFLTNITHEIRTPLTVILGFTTILRQGLRTDYHRFVNLIERSGRRLLLMLDSMIDLAQLEAGTLEIERQSQSVLEVIDAVVASVRPLAAEKDLSLRVIAPDQRFYARFDHSVLTRVLNNMLDNAIKFTDEGGVEVHVRRDNASIEVVVRDTGIGIDQNFLPHVFDPFVQESTGLDRTHQGSGLGLSVSRRLIELMGGSITMSSTKGEGSVFTIILPAVD